MIIQDLFKDRTFNRKLWSLTFPITLQSLMLALVAAADALMLGLLNQDAMAAVSLATQVQFVQNMLLGGIVAGYSACGESRTSSVVRRFFVRRNKNPHA